MDLLLVLVALVAFLGLLTWHHNRRPPNFPSGPWTPPIVGVVPFVSYPTHEQIDVWGKRHGGIFSVKHGNYVTVICSSWRTIKAVFLEHGENFIGRPILPVSIEIMGQNDIASTGGDIWKERKRFCLFHFKNMGFSKSAQEEFIMEETVTLIDKLKAHGTGKMEVTYLFFFPLLNVIWRFVGGKRFTDEEKMKTFVNDLIILFEQGTGNNVLLFMPYLRNMPFFRKRYQRLKAAHHKVSAFIEQEVDEHIRTFQEGRCRGLIDAFVAEMRKKDQSKERANKFKKEVLVGMSYDFFNAAVDAGNHTLAWALLYMATWRDIQEKVQAELDRVVGRDRLPTYPDKASLVYTEATLMEIMRYSSVAPLSVPHSAIAPTKVLGYDLPKDTMVIESIWGVHFDPELWGDPKVFRPERFITEKGEIHRPEYWIPFGIGARMCMGPPLGKVEMFMIFAALMHQFTVSYVSGELPPTFNAVVGLNSRPEDFGLSFTPR